MLAIIALPVLALGLLLIYFVSRGIYNVFFHPLRHYPGSLLDRSSLLPSTYYAWTGEKFQHVTEMHEQYGSVVRVAPDELSYIEAQAWQDIAGHKSASGGGNLPKDLKNSRREPNGVRSIITAAETDHRRMRRLQSHMFADKALKEQEPLIASYVDLLISRLHEKAAKPETAVLDVVKWFNYTTFDILGDLAFGDSFGCLKSDVLHPWVQNIFTSVKDSGFYRLARAYPSPIFELLRWLSPRELADSRVKEFNFAAERARERINQGSTDRVDFMSYILKYNDEKGMSMKELESNASVLIVAGSETTATFLSGITYSLLRTPHVLKKLTDLVRTTFPLESDIDIVSVQQLEYFTACLEEGLRIYPPVPGQIPRTTVGEGSTINGRYVPPGTAVMVSQFAAFLSPTNFADPNQFVPERWLKDPPAQYANDNRKVMQPFSVGPRNCIGRNLAYAEMRMILARFLWNFDLELQPDSTNWSSQRGWILWEKPPLNVKLTPRKF